MSNIPESIVNRIKMLLDMVDKMTDNNTMFSSNYLEAYTVFQNIQAGILPTSNDLVRMNAIYRAVLDFSAKIDPPNKYDAELKRLYDGGMTGYINLIKEIRVRYGFGLKEAKGIVDSFSDRNNLRPKKMQP